MPAVTYKTRLPWILGAVFFVLYLLTLNRWVSVETLGVIAPIAGWDFWGLRLNAPVFRLITIPFYFLPQSVAIVGVGVLNAILASFAIAWLARTVMLMPQDRSSDQRARNNDPDGLYVGKFLYIPPIVAAISLGLMFNFWSGATGASTSILNVFLLAYIARNTMEHRLDGENVWIYRAAAVFSIAIVNNWFMILLFPFWVGAVIWINGKDLLKYGDLIIRSILCFLPGFLLFLFLPLAEYMDGRSDLDFMSLLSMELSFHAQGLRSIPPYILFIYSTFSLLPLVFLSVAWDQTRSGNAGINTTMTRVGVRAMNLFFFLYTMAIAFDLPLCPRYLTPGFDGLEFHFIAALVLGLTTGYMMVVYHSPVTEHRQKRYQVSGMMQMVRPVFCALVFVCAGAMTAGLLYKNYPEIRSNRGETLYNLGCDLVKDIKKAQGEKPVTLFSDDPLCLYLVQATLARQGDKSPYIFVDTRFLSYPWYHRQMARYYSGRWQDHFSKTKEITYLDTGNMIQWMLWYAGREDVYYLHPSFGHFFEACRPTPVGLLTRLTPYQDANMDLWVMSEEEKAAALAYWAGKTEMLEKFPKVPKDLKRVGSGVLYSAAYYARVLNNYAVALERAGAHPDAIAFCEKALKLYPQNLAAMVNLQYYRFGSLAFSDEDQRWFEELFNDYESSWEGVNLSCGQCDVPVPLYEMGTTFMQNQQWRQAFQCFLRVEQLVPDDVKNMVALAYVDSMIGESDRALQRIRDAKVRCKEANVPASGLIVLDTQEAACLLSAGKVDEALNLMIEARKTNPQDSRITSMLVRAYIAKGDYNAALPFIDKVLSSSPENAENLRKKVYCLMGLNRTAEALTIVDGLLRKNPLDESVRILRVTALIQAGNLAEATQEYQGMLEVNNENLTALLGLGELAQKQGLEDEAHQWYSQALTNRLMTPGLKAIVEAKMNQKPAPAPAPAQE